MPLKDILVCVDPTVASSARVDLAVRLAAAHGAHLTALFMPGLPHIPEYVKVQLPPSVLELQEKTAREEAQRAETQLRKAASAAGLDVEWRVSAAANGTAAMLNARYFDLAVVGQDADAANDVSTRPVVVMAEDLALGSGRPVLITPRYGKFPKIGERILIAWSGTREATRAVHDALAILVKAKQAIILSVNPGQAIRERVPGADIALHLARHGVCCETTTTEADNDIEVGDLLLSRAADFGADMMVMGAYGHSRTRELVLGGVTRHILRHMTVPVLVSH